MFTNFSLRIGALVLFLFLTSCKKECISPAPEIGVANTITKGNDKLIGTIDVDNFVPKKIVSGTITVKILGFLDLKEVSIKSKEITGNSFTLEDEDLKSNWLIRLFESFTAVILFEGTDECGEVIQIEVQFG